MADLDFPSPTEDSAPPPAYEFSQQEFDQKLAAATEHSLSIAEQEQQQRQAVEDDVWEEWDEAKFQANASCFAESSNQATSSSSAVHAQQPAVQSSASAKAREAFPNEPYHVDQQNQSSSTPVRPLSITKKSAKQPETQMEHTKERPSWYDEAQLGVNEGGSSSQAAPHRVTSPRRALPVPTDQQARPQHIIPDDPEEDRSIPPPPFAPIGDSLDGPAYERYPSDQQGRSTGPVVVLTYTGADLAASPPPSPPHSPITQAPSLNLRRRDTPPRIMTSQSAYPHMQYHIPQPTRRQSRPSLPHQPRSPVSLGKQQYVPPPPRMDFNPSVAYEGARHANSVFGQLPTETLKRGEGAAALYNSAVAAHMKPQGGRQPVAPQARRYAGSIISTTSSDYPTSSMYQQQVHSQANLQTGQQVYGVQSFAASNVSFYPQTNVNPITQYPQLAQYPVQQGYPDRPMSSLSQGDKPRWVNAEPQHQQQYYQR